MPLCTPRHSIFTLSSFPFIPFCFYLACPASLANKEQTGLIVSISPYKICIKYTHFEGILCRILYIMNFYEAIPYWEQVPFHGTESAKNKIYHEKSLFLLRLRDYLTSTDTMTTFLTISFPFSFFPSSRF